MKYLVDCHHKQVQPLPANAQAPHWLITNCLGSFHVSFPAKISQYKLHVGIRRRKKTFFLTFFGIQDNIFCIGLFQDLCPGDVRRGPQNSLFSTHVCFDKIWINIFRGKSSSEINLVAKSYLNFDVSRHLHTIGIIPKVPMKLPKHG